MAKRSQMLLTMFALQLVGIIITLIVLLTLMSLTRDVSITINEFDASTAFYLATRRMLSSADCLAYEHKNILYHEPSGEIIYSSRVYPNTIDYNKLMDYENVNCMRKDFFDLTSDVSAGRWDAIDGSGGVFKYSITVYDMVTRSFIYPASNDYQANSFIARVDKTTGSKYDESKTDDLKTNRWSLPSEDACLYALENIEVYSTTGEMQSKHYSDKALESFVRTIVWNIHMVPYIMDMPTKRIAVEHDIFFSGMVDWVIVHAVGTFNTNPLSPMPVLNIYVNDTLAGVATCKQFFGKGSCSGIIPRSFFEENFEGSGTYLFELQCTNCNPTLPTFPPTPAVYFGILAENSDSWNDEDIYPSNKSYIWNIPESRWDLMTEHDWLMSVSTKSIRTWNQKNTVCTPEDSPRTAVIPTFIKYPGESQPHAAIMIYESCVITGSNYSGRTLGNLNLEPAGASAC